LIVKNKNVSDDSLEITLYNQKPLVHKLSHQHLYTNFYIVKTDVVSTLDKDQKLVSFKEIHKYPVPILLGNFIDAFFN